jgi:hypothetical protein
MATAKVESGITIDIKVKLTLTFEEARALEAMTVYGHKSFLEGYYKQLGKSYMQPHEKGLISLFETIKQNLPPELKKVDSIIKHINDLPK